MGQDQVRVLKHNAAVEKEVEIKRSIRQRANSTSADFPIKKRCK
tara:strand:- start:303 stop:434 length:132 start_codon:yes stop_codon:yes gene_type:complete